MDNHSKTPILLIGILSSISLILTILCTLVYFFLGGEQKFFSYPFYQQISLFIYQSQENEGLALFRIPGIFLLGGCLGFVAILFLISLLVSPFNARKKKKPSLATAYKKETAPQVFKVPSPLMYVKWIVLLVYLAAIFYFAGYYFNDILNPIDIWMEYVLFYMYGILGGIFINLLFNLTAPLRTNRYLEFTFLALLGGGFALAYFYLDVLGISLVYYIHCCVLFGIIAFLSAIDFCSIDAKRCEKCHGRCNKTLINSEYTDLGTGIGFEDRTRKVGTRETTYTITDERGTVLGEAKGSEDIYEDYVGTYETNDSKTTNTYDCECVHCHHHKEAVTTTYSSKRV